MSPPGGSGVNARDARELQRVTVGERHVPVEAADEDGPVGRERVDQLLRRQRRRRPTLVIPVAARNPTPRRKLLRETPDALGELLRRRRVAQVHARELKAARQKMHVRVVEARQHERALRVHDARARAHMSASSRPTCRPRRCGCREPRRPRRRARRVHRPHGRVRDDEVGLERLRRRVSLRTVAHDDTREDEQGKFSDCFHVGDFLLANGASNRLRRLTHGADAGRVLLKRRGRIVSLSLRRSAVKSSPPKHTFVDTLTRSLRAFLRRDQVIDDPEELLVYECDGLTHYRARPRAVVLPHSTEEVAEVLRVLAREGVSFAPRGAGTGLSGGALALERRRAAQPRADAEGVEGRCGEPSRGGRDGDGQRAALARGRAARAALRARPFEPGVVHRRREHRGERGRHPLPEVRHDGRSRARRARRARRTAKSSNSAARESKRPATICSASSSAPKGTFGVATEATVRLTPVAPSVRTLLADFTDIDDASRAVSAIIAEGIIPAALEMVDGATIRAVEASVFAAGLPTDAEAALLVELDGLDAGLDAEASRVEAICRACGARGVRHAARRGRAQEAVGGAQGRVRRDGPHHARHDVAGRGRPALAPARDSGRHLPHRARSTGCVSPTSSTRATATSTRSCATTRATATRSSACAKRAARSSRRACARAAPSRASTASGWTRATTSRSSSPKTRCARCCSCARPSTPPGAATPARSSPSCAAAAKRAPPSNSSISRTATPKTNDAWRTKKATDDARRTKRRSR